MGFPKALGILLIVGCVCCLVDTFAVFLFPSLGESIHAFITIPAAIAEIWMVGDLLEIGVRTVPAEQPATQLIAAA